MSHMEELQGRITQALDRVARAVEHWDPAAIRAQIEALEAQAEQAAVVDAEADMSPDTEAPMSPAPGDDTELAALREALEDEKLANAQLEERCKALRARLDNETAGLQEQLEAQRDAMAQLDADLQRLRQSNEALSQLNTDLREANAKGVGEPHLINKAMLTELEALRATRSADAAEARLVLGAVEAALGAAEKQEQAS